MSIPKDEYTKALLAAAPKPPERRLVAEGTEKEAW
jgi:hypothetical protein